MADGKSTPIPSRPVTLNSFQGPFLGADPSVVKQQRSAVSALSANTGLAARWTLKRVQGDAEMEFAL
jgi:hypothetical protein